MELPSQSIEDAVSALSTLPGIGRKTALRLALHLLKTPTEKVEELSTALVKLRRDTRRCSTCYNICDAGHTHCAICRNTRRDPHTICVVAELQDLLAIEKTGQYRGRYHILGGLIDPMNGVSPGELHIEALLERLQSSAAPEQPTEVILALPGSMEGETTAFYLARKLQPFGVALSHIARGIPMSSELEYTDELTIARSLQQRTAYSLPQQ